MPAQFVYFIFSCFDRTSTWEKRRHRHVAIANTALAQHHAHNDVNSCSGSTGNSQERKEK